MPAPSSVLIIDDHPLFREGLKSLIGLSQDYCIVGEAVSVEEAIPMARQTRPELITMDITLGEIDGIVGTRQLTALLPETRILMLSMHAKVEYVTQAFQAGARGYLVKDAAGEKLIEAMDVLGQGEFYLDGQLSREVVIKMLTTPKGAASADEKYDLLSPREQQVMRLVAEGDTSRQIAERLALSPKTVENHRTNLMKKLEVHNKLELVRYAARLGLINVDEWKE